MYHVLFGVLLAALLAVGLSIYVDSHGAKMRKGWGDALSIVAQRHDREVAQLKADLDRVCKAMFPSPGGMVPQVGRIVQYLLPDGPGAGELRPAIIVRVWAGKDGAATPASLVQLQVFNDGNGGTSNDGLPNVQWRTSVRQGLEPGTWRDPRRAIATHT